MNGCPEWVKYVQSNVELGTLRQEKEQPVAGVHYPKDGHTWSGCDKPPEAGCTCEECPNPLRPFENEEGLTEWTQRCKTCNTKMVRWVRKKKLEKRILLPTKYFENDGAFVAFVTLTIPNVRTSKTRDSLPNEVRKFKKRVAGFRRRKTFENKILGGIDVFENTVRPNGDWNIHHHGIWIMRDYWNQDEFQDEWGYRTRIEKVRKPYAVLRYLMTYARKQPIEGVRCLETFGQSRGAAYTAIEGFVRPQKDSTGAAPARGKSMRPIKRPKWYEVKPDYAKWQAEYAEFRKREGREIPRFYQPSEKEMT